MNKKIVIFDLDGTLLNTLEDLTDSTNYALEKFGYDKKSLNEVKSFVGNGVSKLIERSIPGGLNNINFERCLEIFKQHYSNNMFNKTKPYPGIINLLKKLKSENVKIAVVSNKFDLAVRELCEKYFSFYIDIALGENEKLGIRKKPFADLILKVLKDFEVEKKEAIYVGDSEVDILTAKNSGISCLSVTWGFKDEGFLIKNGAEIIINSPLEIMKYL